MASEPCITVTEIMFRNTTVSVHSGRERMKIKTRYRGTRRDRNLGDKCSGNRIGSAICPQRGVEN